MRTGALTLLACLTLAACGSSANHHVVMARDYTNEIGELSHKWKHGGMTMREYVSKLSELSSELAHHGVTCSVPQGRCVPTPKGQGGTR
jgi:hypothetical protein